MFCLSPLALDLGQDVRLAQDEQVLAVDLDLRPAVLRVQDLVALGHVERHALTVVVELAVADGEDLALLGLLLGGVGKDETGCGRLLFLDRPDDQAIAEGLELHASEPPLGLLALSVGECQPLPEHSRTPRRAVKIFLGTLFTGVPTLRARAEWGRD